MKFNNSNARLFVPDGAAGAMDRITHLGIGAHQDDLEFMAYHGILACYHSESDWFGGVTCTDGAGSARTGDYAKYTDDEMRKVRVHEQENAAVVGRFGAMIQLGYASGAIKSPTDPALKEDIKRIIQASRPRVVYTHNPADKHDTHIGVVIATLQALRELPPEERPEAVFGCEVWRGLDWMPDEDKVVHDVSAHENLAAALNGVFDSQISGGKRYDLATLGRRRANATFFESHATDQAQMISFAMDLTPLVKDATLSILDYVLSYISRFENDVRGKLTKRLGSK
ncbi:MAG TPA: PIG-L family deacetylase [Chthoniobacteraceae bacterium]|jgi:LmbE family N-acetylglucosaminyl deacetylase|nr:PIG-L family deacetylase [Chthoniobacteraceae bacterium]